MFCDFLLYSNLTFEFIKKTMEKNKQTHFHFVIRFFCFVFLCVCCLSLNPVMSLMFLFGLFS